MTLSKITIALLAASALTLSLSARDQIKMVGSSTVYPFASSVSEEFSATTKNPTPVVESTGTGGGMKLFCASSDMSSPDITNASRRMKAEELKLCETNGVTDITEAIIGFDGIAFAQSKANTPFNVTKKQLFLAVAAEVPSADGKTLVANPYKKWSDIDASLPNREITIYGPPKSSGTRDAFEDMILKAQTEKMDVYTKVYEADKVKNKGYKEYGTIRTDGVYVEAGENDNLIVAKLDKNRAAFGVFGYSFLEENADKVQGSNVDGIAPTPDNISSGKYPVSRSLFFYVKNAHAAEIKSLNDYVTLFMSEKMIGKKGILGEIGLIPLPEKERTAIRESVFKKEKVTAEMLSHK